MRSDFLPEGSKCSKSEAKNANICRYVSVCIQVKCVNYSFEISMGHILKVVFFLKNLYMHFPFLNLVVLRFWWRWQFHCVVNDQGRGGAPGWIARDVLFWSQQGAFDQSACTPALTVVPNYLMVWNMFYFSIDSFPYMGNVIISIDFHTFQRGWNHQPGALGPKKKLTKRVLKSFWRIQRVTS